MKTMIFLLLLSALTLTLFPGQEDQTTAAEPQSAADIDFTAGLKFCYNRVPVLLGEDKTGNSLVHSYLALEIEAGLKDYLILGVVAGYDTNHFNDAVDFYRLPLSLHVDDQSFNSMVFGVKAKSDFFSWKDFSFVAQGELLFFKLFKKEFPIDLPIAKGTSTVKQSFSQLALELLVQYDGFPGFTVFAGPQLNLLKGSLTASEKIEELEGEEKLTYRQKNKMGIAAGINIELSSQLELNVKVNVISKTSLSVEVFYIF